MSTGANQPAPAAKEVRRPGRLRRWLVRLLLLGAVAALLYLLRFPLLRCAATVLIAESPARGGEYVLILGGDGCLDLAAKLVQAGTAHGILLSRQRPNRLERLGLSEPGDLLSRRELNKKGVPDPLIELLPGEPRTDWDRSRLLGEWLERHPGGTVTVLCNRFGSRRKLSIFGKVLGEEQHRRISLTALQDRQYDETSWWRSKDGVLDFCNAWAGLTYVWLFGEDSAPWREAEVEMIEGGP